MSRPSRATDMRTKVPPVRTPMAIPKTNSALTWPPAPSPARFGQLCQSCLLQAACTKARRGRVISIHPHEAALQHPKARQKDQAWQQAYRANHPVVERKISHFTHRPWGARKARCRGHARILTDILTRASVINLARLATLGLHHGPRGWAIA
jgi:hypothetical protein